MANGEEQPTVDAKPEPVPETEEQLMASLETALKSKDFKAVAAASRKLDQAVKAKEKEEQAAKTAVLDAMIDEVKAATAHNGLNSGYSSSNSFVLIVYLFILFIPPYSILHIYYTILPTDCQPFCCIRPTHLAIRMFSSVAPRNKGTHSYSLFI